MLFDSDIERIKRATTKKKFKLSKQATINALEQGEQEGLDSL